MSDTVNDPSVLNEINAMVQDYITELEDELEQIVAQNPPELADFIRSTFWSVHEQHRQEAEDNLEVD